MTFQPEASSTSASSSSYVGSSVVVDTGRGVDAGTSASINNASADSSRLPQGISGVSSPSQDGFLAQSDITAGDGHVWVPHSAWTVDPRELLFSDDDSWRYASSIESHVWYADSTPERTVRRRRWFRSQVAADAAPAPTPTTPSHAHAAGSSVGGGAASAAATTVPPLTPQSPEALREQWVSDNDADTCMCCQTVKFSFFNRRHHCRHCGHLVCDACSKSTFTSVYSILGGALTWRKGKHVVPYASYCTPRTLCDSVLKQPTP